MRAQNAIQIYDFENAIEGGFKALLAAAEIAAVVSLDEAKFQEVRPRVNLFFSPGEEMRHWYVDQAQANPRHLRTDAYTGTLLATIVTVPKATTREHSDYRATIRDLMAGAKDQFKADMDAADADQLLPYHSIIDVVESGTAPNYRDEEGAITSAISYAIKFNIRPEAWPAT